MKTILYHVTPQYNQDSIDRRGIDPSFCKGKLASCYYVEEKQVLWALMHVSQRFRMPVDSLVIFPVVVERAAMTKTSMQGVFRTKAILYPEPALSIESFVSPDTDDTF